jgi:hypothetical protein
MRPLVIKKIVVFIFLISGYFLVNGQGTLVDFNTIPKSGTALVLSHMDDDVIWMLPWWKITEKFICGAMPPTPVYQTIVSQQQDYLNANGYNIDYESNWLTPWGMITHGEYSDYYWDNQESVQYLAEDHLIAFWDNGDLQLVRTEINRIKAKLEQYIASTSVSRIITHNNWGEYGHQHHRAINKAVRELAVKYRKEVWMLGCDNGDFQDVDVPNGITYTMGSFNDPALFSSLRTIYQNNWCWTWPDNIPSGDHKFIEIVEAGADKSNILTGESVTVSGPAQSEPGAYIFDGVDDFMTLEGNSTTAFTVAMRVRPAVIASMDISKMTEYPSNATSDRNFYLNSNGTVSARIYDGSSKVATSTTALTPGNWTHIVMTGNGSSLKIYVNGVLENTIPAGSAITSYATPEFVMGQPGVTSAFFNGQINDVKLYDRALTDSEIAALNGVVYTINANAGTGGVISPAGVVTVTIGSNSTFNITPDESYLISDVKVDNISVGALATYTFSNVNASHTISAAFIPKIIHTITVEAGINGTISPSGSVPVAEGTNKTFTITPNMGYQISDVFVDNVSVGAVAAYTFNNVQTDHTIRASYTTVPTWSVTAGSGAGGSITPSGTVIINQGSNQTFNITPNTGYRISNVLVDNNSIGAVSTYTFSNIIANHTISASFALIPIYTITTSSGAGGSINPSGNVSVIEGANSTFTITPNSGYYITNVLADNVSVGSGSTYTFSNVTANHTISATFALSTFSITSSTGSGGSISPLGTVTVNYGASSTFSITPNAGYIISSVRVDNVSVGAVSSYTFSNVTSSHTIAAAFTPITYTVTSSAGAGGSISPSGSVSAAYGTNRTFSITPNSGYYISDVRVDNVSVGAVSSYTFNSITANHTISATFALYTYAITASAGAGGSITPTGTSTMNWGTSQTYSITPNTGFNISDVRVDNISIGAVSSYTFSNLASNHTISATFSQLTYTITGSYSTGGSITPAGTITVNHGSNQTYSVTSNYGYEISDVRVDNVPMGTLSSYTFSNITSNHIISAAFSLVHYTITGSSGTGGSVTPSGTMTLTHGSNQTYTISPNTGFEISDVTVDGTSVGPVSSYTFTGITAGHTISATFSVIKYTITPVAGSGGSINPQNEIKADYGTSSSFTITPDEGYDIADVIVDNVSVGAVSNYTFTGITENHAISVSFVLKKYTIAAGPGANGSITPEGVSAVDYGTNKVYTINPDDGYKISDVIVDNASVGAVSSYTFEDVVSNHTISASFEYINLYKIASNAGSGGSINPKGIITIPEESSQTYLISPDNGYRILKVLVDNLDLGTLPEYTFSSVSSDHSISAEFTSETEVIVYPNPFTDKFTVKIETPLNGKFHIIVFDVASRIVYNQTDVDGNEETIVNLNSSPRGVYIIRLYYDDLVIITTKVIKL